MSPIAFCQIEDIVAQVFENGKMPFIVALDGVTDVRNFGAIVRSAECAGVDAIVVPEKGASRIGPDAVKTSAGALHKVPICRTSSLKKTLQTLMDSGLTICGATEKTDNLEEISENREQIEISKYYEKLPKSTLIATKEYEDGKLYHRNVSKEKEGINF